MSRKSQKALAAKVDSFVKQYKRHHKNTPDPNDHGYDRKLEAKIKRMDPLELDKLLHSEDDN